MPTQNTFARAGMTSWRRSWAGISPNGRLHTISREMPRHLRSACRSSPVRNLEIEYVDKEGRFTPIEINAIVLQTDAGVRVLALSRDITDRKQAERHRAELQEQLFHAQKMEAVGQLASGVAHDFNNLLMAITGQIEILGSQFPENRVLGDATRMIQDAVQQAVGVTRSLLTFSRSLPLDKKPILLQDIVQVSMRILGRLLPASIHVEFDCPADPPLWIQTDATQIQQVVLNLAINARDAMQKGGTLGISVRLADRDQLGSWADLSGKRQYVCLTVSDTGGGISAEALTRLFEPFFSTKPRGQGTGLGLSIVHGIIKNHDGHIEVDSDKGKQTTFRVFLPCAESDAEDDLAAVPGGIATGRGEIVLVAEDNPFVRDVICDMLKHVGYEVISVGDGQSLLDTWNTHRSGIQLVISDIDLPGRDGLYCLREIRSRDGSVPVLLVTGSPSDALEDELDAETLLLRKPFRMGQMASLVSQLIGKGTAQGGPSAS